MPEPAKKHIVQDPLERAFQEITDNADRLEEVSQAQVDAELSLAVVGQKIEALTDKIEGIMGIFQDILKQSAIANEKISEKLENITVVQHEQRIEAHLFKEFQSRQEKKAEYFKNALWGLFFAGAGVLATKFGEVVWGIVKVTGM